MPDKIITVYKKVCDHCHEEFNFREDHILHLTDVTEAYKNIYVDSILCPNCHGRNILGSRDIDGKETRREYEVDEVATRAFNAK